MMALVKWNSKMSFQGESGGQTVALDAKAPLGEGRGFTPKELLAVGIAGCTAMDVIALLKKHRQVPDSFEVNAKTESVESGHPAIFRDVELTFIVKGNVEKDRLLESVKASQTKYCSVSAMVSKAVPIRYEVMLNDVHVGSGRASFE